MSLLQHNWIADASPVTFLGVYAALIVSVALVAWLLAHRDSSRALGGKEVVEDPDPYLLTLLKSGRSDLVRVVTFSLIQRGYLQDPDSPVAAPAAPDERHLSSLEANVLRSAGGLSGEVERECQALELQLVDEQLLAPDSASGRNLIIRLVAVGLVGGVGLCRVLTAPARLESIGFLIVLWLAGMVLCWFIVPSTGRLTQRGQRFLREHELEFGDLRDHLALATSGVAEQVDPRANEPLLVLLLAIFGTTVFKDTAYEHLVPDEPTARS